MVKIDKQKSNPPDWMSVFITHDLQEAHIIAGKLKANDIPAMVHTQPGASAIGITIGSLGEIKVLVDSVDYDNALDILYPEDAVALEDTTDEMRIIWHEDEKGAEYYLDEEDDE